MTAGSQREEQRVDPGAENKPGEAECRHHRACGDEQSHNDHRSKEQTRGGKDKQAKEIKSLKAQLSVAQKENKKLKGDIFGVTF